MALSSLNSPNRENKWNRDNELVPELINIQSKENNPGNEASSGSISIWPTCQSGCGKW